MALGRTVTSSFVWRIMFDQLFTLPHARARHRTGPLFRQRRAFLAQLADRGVSRGTLRQIAPKLLVLIKTFRLVKRPKAIITLEEIRRKAPDKYRYLSLARRWLRFLGRLEPQPVRVCPCAAKIKIFAEYMEHERGLSPATIESRCRFLPRFLDCLGVQGTSLDEVTLSRLDATLGGMAGARAYSRYTLQGWVGILRAFFRFAESRGWCRKGLATIRSPRSFSQTSLPTGPSWEAVRQLLAMTDGNRRTDIRDRAILVLLAMYGLRAGEVIRLRLDDIDWEREQFTTESSKTRRSRTYPLTRTAGDAILRYLKEVRPGSSHRQLFLTFRPPVRPMRTVWFVVSRRLRTLNISIPHYGPHALRHTCAEHLLAQGLGLKEIGDQLGHLDPDTTRLYAKVDLGALRQVADFDLGGLA